MLEGKYKTIPQDNMYLFGLLLSFFDSDMNVNITLAGYVAKVFNSLFDFVKNKNKETEVDLLQLVCFDVVDNYPLFYGSVDSRLFVQEGRSDFEYYETYAQ